MKNFFLFRFFFQIPSQREREREIFIINKTKKEIPTDEFIVKQDELIKEIANERKQEEREAKELSKQYEYQKKQNADLYADLFASESTSKPTNWSEDSFW